MVSIYSYHHFRHFWWLLLLLLSIDLDHLCGISILITFSVCRFELMRDSCPYWKHLAKIMIMVEKKNRLKYYCERAVKKNVILSPKQAKPLTNFAILFRIHTTNNSGNWSGNIPFHSTIIFKSFFLFKPQKIKWHSLKTMHCMTFNSRLIFLRIHYHVGGIPLKYLYEKLKMQNGFYHLIVFFKLNHTREIKNGGKKRTHIYFSFNVWEF